MAIDNTLHISEDIGDLEARNDSIDSSEDGNSPRTSADRVGKLSESLRGTSFDFTRQRNKAKREIHVQVWDNALEPKNRATTARTTWK